MKKAFTLAETLIVLVVIGILAAILLPVARNIVPDRNLMKFKKAHTTLGNAIRELVQSEEYYLNGDLGVKLNGDLIDGNHAGDKTYFCKTLAEVMNVKTLSCSEYNYNSTTVTQYSAILNIEDGAYQSHEQAGLSADLECKKAAKTIGSEFATNDGVIFYQTAPNFTFGILWKDSLHYSGDTVCENVSNIDLPICTTGRLFSGTGKVWHTDSAGFDRVYKIFCIDIDGIPANVTNDDCVNECPFGYGIRGDGKIFTGARAKQWLEKE